MSEKSYEFRTGPNKEITGVKVQGQFRTLRKPVRASELEAVLEMAQKLDEEWDLEGTGKKAGPKSRLEQFLEETTKKQRVYFIHPLAEAGKWVDIDDLKARYRKDHPDYSDASTGIAIAGLQAPMTIKAEKMGLEPFWEREINEKLDRMFYRIKPDKLDDVKEALDELES